MPASVQKKQGALDKIAENETPSKNQEKKNASVNPFVAGGGQEQKGLIKQPTIPKFNIDIKLPKKVAPSSTTKQDEGQELKS